MSNSWYKYYYSEEELTKAISTIDVDKLYKLCNLEICKGCRHIASLARSYECNGELSPIQIKSAQRLAKYIYRYHDNKHILDC
jgi:hypothetical protein